MLPTNFITNQLEISIKGNCHKHFKNVKNVINLKQILHNKQGFAKSNVNNTCKN